ncbi:hypothetical protein ACVWYH_009748 [Bradyrhizobium sp. GM24.11]
MKQQLTFHCNTAYQGIPAAAQPAPSQQAIHRGDSGSLNPPPPEKIAKSLLTPYNLPISSAITARMRARGFRGGLCGWQIQNFKTFIVIQ